MSEAARDAVIVTDADGRTLSWSPAAERMFGYAAQEVLGRDLESLLAGSSAADAAAGPQSALAAFRNGLATGRLVVLTARRRNGEPFPAELALVPVGVGTDRRVVAVVRDLTLSRAADEAARAERAALLRRLQSHEQERTLMACEIHDGVAQQLAGTLMQCEAAERTATQHPETAVQSLRGLQAMLRQCLDETRRLIRGARLPMLDEADLATAIEKLVEHTRRETGPRIELRSRLEGSRFEPVLENAVYRIVQEALRNACRHSRSDRVLIELSRTPTQVRVSVQDWGIGFDPQQVEQHRFGLAGIRERARLLGGRAAVQSAPGQGTTVLVELLLDANLAQEA